MILAFCQTIIARWKQRFEQSPLHEGRFYKHISLMILASLALLFLLRPQLLLFVFDDITAHLLFAQGFARAGGITLWENWQSLPAGRAHVYPPALHTVMAGLVTLGFEPFTILKIVSFSVVMGLLSVSWWVMSKLCNHRMAFLYLLILSADSATVYMFSFTAPASIVILLAPLLLYLTIHHRWTGALVLMTLLWYTHMAFPYLVAFGLLVWSIINRTYFLPVVKILLGSYILFLPWLVQIIKNAIFVRYTDHSWVPLAHQALIYDANLSILLLFAVSLVALAFFWDRWSNNKIVPPFFLAILTASLPLLAIYPVRFFESVGTWTMAVVIAYIIDNSINMIAGRYRFATPLIILAIIAATAVTVRFAYNPNYSIGDVYTKAHLFYQGARAVITTEAYPGMLTYYPFTPDNLALAKTIANSTAANEPLLNASNTFELRAFTPWVEYIIPQFFAALANRPMANVRYPENQWYRGLPINDAPIVLADTHQTSLFVGPKTAGQQQLADLLDRQFTVIGESGRLVAFGNQRADIFTTQPVRPVVPLWLGLGIILAAIGFVIYTTLQIKKER